MNGEPMRRREFITLLGCTATWPLAAGAQQRPAMPVVGYLLTGTPEGTRDFVAGFRRGMGETGFVEGRNVAVEYRWSNNVPGRVTESAADLVQRRVAVISASSQDQATRLVGQNQDLSQAQRNQLRGLSLKSATRTVSEGDLVEFRGFLIGLPTRPGASGAESVNCRLSGASNSDFHIPMSLNADDSEFEGIVVEMIPQDRNPGWTTKKLKRAAREGRPVIVRGQLFYDNKHLVNDDPDEPLHGQPKRHSLWEIHPVTALLVCMTANKKCTQLSQFRKLEQIPVVFTHSLHV